MKLNYTHVELETYEKRYNKIKTDFQQLKSTEVTVILNLKFSELSDDFFQAARDLEPIFIATKKDNLAVGEKKRCTFM